MRVGISNIGWAPEDVERYTQLALDIGFDYIESVYSKMPMSKSVYSVQGIFHQSPITSFDDKDCYEYCCSLIDDCIDNDVKIITFGSPSMRVGDKNSLISLVRDLGFHIGTRDCTICIEPNSRVYGGEYYHTVSEIVSDIHSMMNVATMIDTGNLLSEGILPAFQYEIYPDYIKHMHVSTQDMTAIKSHEKYAKIISSVRELGYQGNVTYECMKFSNIEQDMERFLKEVWNRGMEII